MAANPPDGSDRCAREGCGHERAAHANDLDCLIEDSSAEDGWCPCSGFVPPEYRSAQKRKAIQRGEDMPTFSPSLPVAESPHRENCPARRGRECECHWTPAEIAKAAEYAKDYEPLFKPVAESPPLPKPKCAGWREMEPDERADLDERTFCDAEESSASGRPCPSGVCATDDNWHKPVAESQKPADEAKCNDPHCDMDHSTWQGIADHWVDDWNTREVATGRGAVEGAARESFAAGRREGVEVAAEVARTWRDGGPFTAEIARAIAAIAGSDK